MRNMAFTGTRGGLTAPQATLLQTTLREYRPDWLLNGLATGADAEAARMAAALGIRIHGHPATHGTDRALGELVELLEDPAPPLVRNRTMVDRARVLAACPRLKKEELRSGTWATIRHARKRGLRIYICWPDGALTVERPAHGSR